MGASSIFDRLMKSMGKQNGGATSCNRLKPQLTSSSLCLTPVLGTAGDVRGIFANVRTGLEKLRQGIRKRNDRVQQRAQQGHMRLRDELADVKSQAKSDQSHLIQKTDECLAESLALAAKESEER